MSMTHAAIIGSSKNGKSTLGRQIAYQVNKPVIVYDPRIMGTGYGLNGWPGYVTNDFIRFERLFWSNPGAAAFIDEASEVFEEHRALAKPMLTAGRHVDQARGGGGHVVFLLSQRFVDLNKTARNQTDRAFIFQVDPTDAEFQAKHWGHDILAEAHRLPKYHYFTAQRGQPVALGKTTI